MEQGARIARGLGLGLSIVERLARVLNHGIALDSNASGGSFFSVTAPIAAPPVAQAATSDVPPPAPPVAATPAIAPLVSAASAASLTGGMALRDGVVSLRIGCAGSLTSCTGSLRLSSRIHGSTRSLGARLVSIRPGATASVRVTVPAGTRRTLRLIAGRSIAVRALLVTGSPDGTQRSLTRSFALRVPH